MNATQNRTALQAQLGRDLAAYGEAREAFGRKDVNLGLVEKQRTKYQETLQALIAAARAEGAATLLRAVAAEKLRALHPTSSGVVEDSK